EAEMERVATAEAELERLREALTRLHALVSRYQELEQRARAAERRNALEEQIEALVSELERSGERLERLEQAPGLLVRYTAELEELLSERQAVADALAERRTAWLRDRQDAETKLQGYRDRAAELREQIRHLRETGEAGVCPTCRRPLGGELEGLVASLEEQFAEVTQDGRWWRSRVDQLSSPPAEIAEQEARLAAVEQRVADRSRRQARCEAAIQELEEM